MRRRRGSGGKQQIQVRQRHWVAQCKVEIFKKRASTVLRTQKGMWVHSAPIHGDWHGVHAAACLGAPTIGDVTPMRRPSLLMRMRPLLLLPLQRHQPRRCSRCHSRC